jgi:glycosyltransferase involved in cell wall biosynthesis
MGGAVDRFIVHEPDQAESLNRIAGIDEESIVVIPHGVELTSRAGPPPGRPFTIGTLGFLTPYKDPDLLLNAFSELKSVLPEARLLFSLSRHPRNRSRRHERSYQDIMRRASSIKGVETYEHIAEEELPSFLHACDLIVLPYRYVVSASGVAGLAIGAGVPILAPEGSGTLGRLDGWSFPRDSGGLAKALVRQSLRLEQMRQQARTLAEERSWQQVARSHRVLYSSLERYG